MVTQLLPAACAALLLVCSCGPLEIPAVQRLDPEAQAEVDRAWNHMLTPADRLDGALLLDVILACRLHVLGADRVRYRAEKETLAGRVTLELDYDRNDPDSGALVFTLTDRAGHVVRCERWPEDLVRSRYMELASMRDGPAAGAQPASPHPRLKEIEAAVAPPR